MLRREHRALALPGGRAPAAGQRHQHGGGLHLGGVQLPLLPLLPGPLLALLGGGGTRGLAAAGRERVREEEGGGGCPACSSAVGVAGREVGLAHVPLPLQAEVAGTVTTPLRFLRAAFLGAESPPLLPVELLPDAGGRADHVPLLVLVGSGGETPGTGRGGAGPALAVRPTPGPGLHAGVAPATDGGGAPLGDLACSYDSQNEIEEGQVTDSTPIKMSLYEVQSNSYNCANK